MEFNEFVKIAASLGLVFGYTYFWYKYNKCKDLIPIYEKKCNFLETMYRIKDDEVEQLRELYLKLETKYNKLKEECDNGNH